MAIRKRLVPLVVAAVLGILAPLALSGPANAVGRNIGTTSVPASCKNSVWYLCLYWDSNFGGALWGTNSAVGNLAGIRFPGNTSGSGQLVKNNAASMGCDTAVETNLWCWSFFNENDSGNYDYLLPQNGGNLFYTWNDEASVDIF